MNVYHELPTIKYPTSVAIGMFDGVHQGHRQVIQTMMDQTPSQSSLVLSFQNHPLSVINPEQKPQLLTTTQEKISLLQELSVDDCVLLEFSQTFSKISAQYFIEDILVKHLKAHHVTVGYNFNFGHRARGNAELLQKKGLEYGFGVSIVPPLTYQNHPVTSSRIRKLLTDGQFSDALPMLNGKYLVGGHVIHGQGIAAKSLGIPTANLACTSPDKLLPPKGVYLCSVKLPHTTQSHYGVLNIGNRPTFDGQELSIEVYIMDFEGILYGSYIEVRLLEYLRTEVRFENVDALKAQIQLDVEKAQNKVKVLRASG